MKPTMQEVFQHLENTLRNEVAPYFANDMLFTLVIRHPTDTESDIYVSNDSDFDGVVAAVERCRQRDILFGNIKDQIK